MTTQSEKPKEGAQAQPYAPSWVNYFAAWVDRLPVPSWSFYLILALLLALLLVIVPWMEGGLPIGAVQLFMPVMITLLLAMLHYLDKRASLALATLRPALKASEEEYDRLRSELTTLPAWPTLLASLAAVLIILLLNTIGGREASIEAFAALPVSGHLVYAVYLLGFWNFGAFLYHTFHQLRAINRIYTGYTRVDVFAMRPLYAFSTITALTAVTLAVATYGWTALNPEGLQKVDLISIGILVLITLLGLAAFVWPLLGIHRLLGDEKGRLLDETNVRLKATIAELHRQIDGGDLEGVDRLDTAMTALELERNALKAIPTWPWEPETLRLLITALGLPLGLWIIQYVLQLLLGS